MKEYLKLINESQYCLFFIFVDEFLDIDCSQYLNNFYPVYAFNSPRTEGYKKNGTKYFSLEESGTILTEKNTGKLLSHPKVIEYIKNTASLANKTPAIIVFKPSAKIDFICEKYNWKRVCVDSKLNRLFEDKLKFQEICTRASVKTIPSVVDEFNNDNFLKYQNIYGSNLVIQSHFGWAGNSTFMLNDWESNPKPELINSPVKYSPYLDGYSLLNNCCLTYKGVIQSPPALQYTGLEPLTKNPFTTVGRQWPSLAPIDVQYSIRDITDKFSNILKDHGYRGFFGLDFLIDKAGSVYLLECNPRLTASYAFYTQIELAHGITPLFIFHLLELLEIPYEFDLDKERSRFLNEELVGSEVTKKNSTGMTIKKINALEAFTDQVQPIILKKQVIERLNEN